MSVVTRKSEVRELLLQCTVAYDTYGLDNCVVVVNDILLTRKVKFPLLEFCGRAFYEHLQQHDHIPFCDAIQKLKTEGGNVLLGIVLQLRLEEHFKETVAKTIEYIAAADIWYVCDIIGERVWGVSLLNEPERTIPEIQKLTTHQSHWIIRSLGAGAHYAIKKGISVEFVETLFKLLLRCSNSSDKEIRQGIGWAAKTTARFHPEIIYAHRSEINNTEKVANWFRRKIEIGLERHHYAQRD